MHWNSLEDSNYMLAAIRKIQQYIQQYMDSACLCICVLLFQWCISVVICCWWLWLCSFVIRQISCWCFSSLSSTSRFICCWCSSLLVQHYNHTQNLSSMGEYNPFTNVYSSRLRCATVTCRPCYTNSNSRLQYMLFIRNTINGIGQKAAAIDVPSSSRKGEMAFAHIHPHRFFFNVPRFGS